MAPDPTFNRVEIRVCSAPVLYFSSGLLILHNVRYHDISFCRSNCLYKTLLQSAKCIKCEDKL